MHLLVQVGLVALGSAAGGLARWGVGVAISSWLGATFPYATLFINVSGSLFLGWFSTMLTENLVFSEAGLVRRQDLQLLIAVGFTGAYTTFSTFEWESHKLLGDGDGLAGTCYMLLSLLLGLLAVRLGVLAVRWQAGGL